MVRKKIFRFVYNVSIVWSVFSILTLLFSHFFPLEFENSNYRFKYYFIIASSVPISILLSLFRLGYIEETRERIVKRIIVTIVISVSAVPVMFFFFLATGFCGYLTDKILFENIQDASIKIVERHYDCGAFDGDYPEYEIYKTVPLTNQLSYVVKTDTNKLDFKVWSKVDN